MRCGGGGVVSWAHQQGECTDSCEPSRQTIMQEEMKNVTKVLPVRLCSGKFCLCVGVVERWGNLSVSRSKGNVPVWGEAVRFSSCVKHHQLDAHMLDAILLALMSAIPVVSSPCILCTYSAAQASTSRLAVVHVSTPLIHSLVCVQAVPAKPTPQRPCPSYALPTCRRRPPAPGQQHTSCWWLPCAKGLTAGRSHRKARHWLQQLIAWI